MGPGAFVCSFLLRLLLRLCLFVLVLSCPGAEKRDPPYPPSCRITRPPDPPSRLLRGSGGWLYDKRGRWEFLVRPLGLVIAKPYSRGGLALFSVFGSVSLAVQALCFST